MKIKVEDAHAAAVFVQDALKQAANKVTPVDTPDIARWKSLSKRLRVDREHIRKNRIFHDHMDEPVTSWEVTVLVDPTQSPMYPVYELMSLAEEILEENYEDNFFLVPATLESPQPQ